MDEVMKIDGRGFKNGEKASVQIGTINRNGQVCLGTRGELGNDHNQVSYKIRCLHCDEVYGANGTDVFQRLCPNCQGGEGGICF